MTFPLRHLALTFLASAFAFAPVSVQAQVWRSLGPSGGDVRALAMDPRNPRDIYLGTTDGHIFGSRDAGEHWQLLGRAGNSPTAVVTSILVAPHSSATLFAGTWTREDRSEGGGVFSSEDGGAHWQPLGLAGHAVRALAMAPSDSNELVAGALDGVFLSSDSGRNWQRISPAGDPELRNVDSIAIDPSNPQIIFAGTFHLPWKTLDGGQHWVSIHSGMVDDSDVFSLAVDPTLPTRIFASACSGIYRSDNAGASWSRVQTIPDSARRTHMVMQDPLYPKVVYAATTEGLWKSADLGSHWQMRTPPSWVINAVLVLPDSGRVILGTDQIGIVVSDDGARFFHVSNDGFNHRQILSVAIDPRHPGHAICVLANAPETILVTNDGGATWFPTGPGLNADKVRRVFWAPDGWFAALEAGGLEIYDESRREWVRKDWAVEGNTAGSARKSRKDAPVINDLVFTSSGWLAATSSGLFLSHDLGASWQPLRFFQRPAAVDSVLKLGGHLWVTCLGGLFHSLDGGRVWRRQRLPVAAGRVLRVVSAGRFLLAEAEHGLYISHDLGLSWRLSAHGLPAAPPDNLVVSQQAWVAAIPAGGLYVSADHGESWDRMHGTVADGVFPALIAPPAMGKIFAASTTEGLYSLELSQPTAPVQTAAAGRR